MALTVETGTGSATADSLISLTNADTYFANHGSPAEWTGLTEAQKESALRYAAIWMGERFRWKGTITYPNTPQALSWPRSGVVDSSGRIVAVDEIPQRIKDLQCEAAKTHAQYGLNKFFERGGQVASRGAQGATISYFQGASVTPSYPFLDFLAQPYINAAGNTLFRA